MNTNEKFNKCLNCDFMDEHYSVRDNGAVYRHRKEGKRQRSLDESWTFGSSHNRGYLSLGGIGVHRIVAKAFLGDLPKPDYVVDHIDTNRANNRPENLRYCSKLENALSNPITCEKIKLICGSIEAFIENPSELQAFQPQDESMFAWMRTVTPEEAKASYDNWKLWAEKKKEAASNYHRKPIGESIFNIKNNDNFYSPMNSSLFKSDDNRAEEKQTMRERKEAMRFTESKTPYCIQEDWRTPTEFLCCPATINDTPILDYYNNLHANDMYNRNQYTEQKVLETALSEKEDKIWVISEALRDSIKPFAVSEIYFKDGKFVHKSISTCFELIGAKMFFTKARGKKWEGELGIDYYSS